jgi:putative ABC transport system permease protein
MWVYRVLLRAYPASFRGEYGEEMLAIFRHRRRDAGGAAGRLLLVLTVAGETARSALAVHWDIVRQDLRYTRRTLGRARGFALTATAIVALGVGANTAAFSITDFVLIRPLPFREPDRLVTIWQRSPGYSRMELSPANIRDWKQAATSFERIGIYRNYGATLMGATEPERVSGAMVTTDFFPVLGVDAAIGRIFAAGEDAEAAPDAVVLGDRLWRAAFGADPDVVGRRINLDDRMYTVVGVMPPGFSFPSRDAELWVPLKMPPDYFRDRNNNELYAIARLKPGVTLAQARAEMDMVAAQSRAQFPKENENTAATVNELRDELSSQGRLMVLALSGAAFCVLLIVCANLANLLLVRAIGRRQELAVRTAMGAGRERLVRQLATESIVLATIGGALGVLLAIGIVPLLWRLVPSMLPTDAVPGVDLRVLAFAAALTIFTAVAFGVAPMLRAGADADPRGLREGPRSIGGRKDRLRAALVIAEVVASVVLLIMTGLLVRALWTVQGRDPGFRSEGVLTLRTIVSAKYTPTEKRAEFYNRILERVRGLPGVTGAAYISGLPMVWRGGIWPIGIKGEELERRADNTASMRFVTPGFFAVMNIPLRRGRDVGDADTKATRFVAVVSDSLVKRYWPGEDPIGKTIFFATRERAIVGVVADIRVRGLERESEPQVYLPYRQVDDGWFWGYTPKDLVVHATTPLAPLVTAVRAVIHSVDPQVPVTDVRTMTDIIDLETASRSLQLRVLSGFALVAFLLAAIGIHGVLSFNVSQRTPEIGVRIALGAQRGDILGMVTKQGVRLVALGLAGGVVLAYFAGRWLQALLVGVPPADLPTFAAVTILTMLMAAAGTLLPTLRALRIDPLRAIRAE